MFTRKTRCRHTRTDKNHSLIITTLPPGITFLAVVCSLLFAACENPFIVQLLEPKTVSFNSNGGSYVSSQNLFKGQPVKRPADPVKSGNYFTGWYRDNGAFDYEWNFDTVPTSDLTLYARWTEYNEYTNGKDKPFKVYDVTTLKYVGRGDENPKGYKEWTQDANYELIANINLSGTGYWTPIGLIVSSGFIGRFNGNGKTITGLATMATEPGDGTTGMFKIIGSGGVVENLALVNCNIGAGANSFIGGLAGVNSGTVRFCSVSGNITGGATVGGIVGENGGTVENCYSTANVSSWGSSIGGVVGTNESTVQNCYATGTVEGNINVGGVVGFIESSGGVINCYSTGTVIGTDFVGGIAGEAENNSKVMNCVALNPNVMATGADEHIGRVAGNRNNYSVMDNNYGRIDMNLNNQAETWSNNISSGNDGADVTSSNYNSENWWKTAGNWSGGAWNFTSIWVWDNAAKLPKLRNVGGQ